jgi:hypothetical protein
MLVVFNMLRIQSAAAWLWTPVLSHTSAGSGDMMREATAVTRRMLHLLKLPQTPAFTKQNVAFRMV